MNMVVTKLDSNLLNWNSLDEDGLGRLDKFN